MSDEHASPQDAAAAPPPTPQTYTPNPRYTAAIPVGGEDTEAALPPELESKLQKRADATKAFLDRVSNGERPILEGGSSQGAHWLGNLIDNASQQGHLPGAPKDYYRAPTYSPEMGYNPASANMVKDSQEIEQDAKENLDIKVRVFGTRRFLTRSQLKKERADCDALIAIPGDNTAIAELNDEITRRFQKFKESKTSFSRPLIIQNDDGYYDALLAQLQLVEYANDEQGKKQRTQIDPERLALSTAIYITKDKDETKTLLSDIRGQIDSPPKPRSREFMSEEKKKTSDAAKTNTPIIPAGATIFVATGTRKKYRELCDIYEKQGLDVNVLPIDLLLDHYVSPPEDGYSYEANAAKKVKAATETWDRMSDAAKEEKLETIGIKLHDLGRKRTPTPLKTNEVFILSEDSGFHFKEPEIAKEPEFSKISGKVHPDAPFPGTETGPGVLGSFGVDNFFKTIDSILERRHGHEGDKHRELVQKSALAITPLAKKGSYLSTSQERPIYEYAAHTKAHFTSVAAPNTGALEFDNFIIPDGGTLTEAELGAVWHTETSPRAQAWQALAYDQQIPFLSKETPRPKLREKDFSVKIVGDDTNSEATKAAIQTLIEQNKIPEFHVDTVPPQIERLNDVQTKMLEGADAVVLAFDPARAQEDFWRNVWTFSSLVVGEQTRDKYKLEKPVYLINPKEGDHAGAFDYLEKLTQDLHVLGTISEDPDMLYRSAATPEEAIEGLKAHRESKNHLRYDPPAYSRGDEILESTGNSSTKDFNVAIFISATNENDMIINTGSYLAKKLAEEGIGVTSGAGMFSGMGGITKSMQTLPDDVEGHHTGITTPHIANEREIKGADGQNIADKFVLTRDIYARIEGLLNVDAAIVAPGGMGTVQEMAGFALLKKMALEDPEHTYTKEFTNKELVLINIPIAIGGKKRHFYDALIDVIPPDQLAPLGIHIVETPEQAMDKMRELREEKKQREREEAATRGR